MIHKYYCSEHKIHDKSLQINDAFKMYSHMILYSYNKTRFGDRLLCIDQYVFELCDITKVSVS